LSLFLEEISRLTRPWATTTLLILSLCGSSALGAADPNAKVFLCAPADLHDEIDRALRDHFATRYQNYCHSLESGRIIDIQTEDIRVQGKSAIVSYVIVFFESCEEGAPIAQVSRRKEHWTRETNGWGPEEVGR
jgi:hypothetical protein